MTPLGYVATLATMQWLAWLAVLCFFVISGLVIGRSLRIKHDGFIPYMTRRVWRIYPPLLICFCLMALIEAALRWSNIPTEKIAAAIPMVESFTFDLPRAALCLATFGFRGWLSSDANVALWSLVIEMRCYVVAGLIAQVMQTKNRFLQAVCVGSLLYLVNFMVHDRTDYQITLSYAAFAAGAVLSLFIERPKLFLPAVSLDISYGLYIFHFPILLGFFFVFYQPSFPSVFVAIALAVVGLALTGVLATCSAVLIERRKLRFALLGPLSPRLP